MLMLPDIGVIGGVVNGRPELVATTPGTLPMVGVGLLVMTPTGVGTCDDCVAIEEVELDRVGLGGRALAAGEGDGANAEGGSFAGDGAVAAVGVGIGDG